MCAPVCFGTEAAGLESAGPGAHQAASALLLGSISPLMRQYEGSARLRHHASLWRQTLGVPAAAVALIRVRAVNAQEKSWTFGAARACLMLARIVPLLPAGRRVEAKV